MLSSIKAYYCYYFATFEAFGLRTGLGFDCAGSICGTA
jgi:hypothetical protein